MKLNDFIIRNKVMTKIDKSLNKRTERIMNHIPCVSKKCKFKIKHQGILWADRYHCYWSCKKKCKQFYYYEKEMTAEEKNKLFKKLGCQSDFNYKR